MVILIIYLLLLLLVLLLLMLMPMPMLMMLALTLMLLLDAFEDAAYAAAEDANADAKIAECCLPSCWCLRCADVDVASIVSRALNFYKASC